MRHLVTDCLALSWLSVCGRGFLFARLVNSSGVRLSTLILDLQQPGSVAGTLLIFPSPPFR